MLHPDFVVPSHSYYVPTPLSPCALLLMATLVPGLSLGDWSLMPSLTELQSVQNHIPLGMALSND